MLRNLLIIFCFLLSVRCIGQNRYRPLTAHFYNELTKNLSDSNRQYCYNRLASLYIAQLFQQPDLIDSALFFARKAAYLGDSTNTANRAITTRSLILLGTAYVGKGDFATGKKIYGQVIDAHKRSGDKNAEADTRIVAAKYFLNFKGPSDYIESEFKKAILLYTETGENKKIIDGQLGLADFHFNTGDYKLADSELKNTLVLSARSDYYKTLDIYNILSANNRYAGNFKEALTYSLAAIKRAEQSAADSFTRSNCYGEAALVYQELNQPGKSIYWYQQCIDIRKRQKHPALYFTVYLMTVQMLKVNQAIEAIKILKALPKNYPPGGAREKSVWFQSLAYCYKAIKDYRNAEQYFLAMIKQYNLQDHSEELEIARYDIGKFYVERGRYELAKQYLPKQKFGNVVGSALSRAIDLHLLWFKIDSADGRFESAIQHLQKYKEMNDSLFSVTKTKLIEELMVQYESEKKDQDIKLLENEKTIQQAEITSVHQARNWTIGVAILFLIIIALLMILTRVNQKNNKKLKSHQKEIEEKNAALEHLVEEKEWLVREIHHRVKNNFHTVVGLLGTQSLYLKTAEALKAVNESQNRIHAMSLIHQKLYQSDNMSAVNMSYYIHELVDYLADSFNVRKSIYFKVDVDPIELELSHCVPIGLIINEAVTNSIKYAFANTEDATITISLKLHSDNFCSLHIADNGQGLPAGFDPLKQSSMGLKLIRGLAGDIDATLTIEGGNGTEIKMDFLPDADIQIRSGQSPLNKNFLV